MNEVAAQSDMYSGSNVHSLNCYADGKVCECNQCRPPNEAQDVKDRSDWEAT
jgi:hypothetical protein